MSLSRVFPWLPRLLSFSTNSHRLRNCLRIKVNIMSFEKAAFCGHLSVHQCIRQRLISQRQTCCRLWNYWSKVKRVMCLAFVRLCFVCERIGLHCVWDLNITETAINSQHANSQTEQGHISTLCKAYVKIQDTSHSKQPFSVNAADTCCGLQLSKGLTLATTATKTPAAADHIWPALLFSWLSFTLCSADSIYCNIFYINKVLTRWTLK